MSFVNELLTCRSSIKGKLRKQKLFAGFLSGNLHKMDKVDWPENLCSVNIIFPAVISCCFTNII